jgi:hypothetical protein
VSFDAITLCVASQTVIPKVSVYFVIDSVRKLLDTPPYILRVNDKIWRSDSFSLFFFLKRKQADEISFGMKVLPLDKATTS